MVCCRQPSSTTCLVADSGSVICCVCCCHCHGHAAVVAVAVAVAVTVAAVVVVVVVSAVIAIAVGNDGQTCSRIREAARGSLDSGLPQSGQQWEVDRERAPLAIFKHFPFFLLVGRRCGGYGSYRGTSEVTPKELVEREHAAAG